MVGEPGSTFLNSFAIPTNPFSARFLIIGAGLGVLASLVMIVFVIVVKSVQAVAKKVPNGYVRGVVGGAIIGLIAVALPLTVGAGNDQLSTVINESASIGVRLLVAVVFGKMLAIAASVSAGFGTG